MPRRKRYVRKTKAPKRRRAVKYARNGRGKKIKRRGLPKYIHVVDKRGYRKLSTKGAHYNKRGNYYLVNDNVGRQSRIVRK